MATLIWRRVNGRYSPAITHQDFADEADRPRTVSKHKLKPGEEVLGFAALAKLYPPPKDKSDENPTDNPKPA